MVSPPKNTLWLFNIAMENGSFIDDFPSYKPPFIRDFPWRWGYGVKITFQKSPPFTRDDCAVRRVHGTAGRSCDHHLA